MTDSLIEWMAAHPWSVAALICACILIPGFLEVPR